MIEIEVPDDPDEPGYYDVDFSRTIPDRPYGPCSDGYYTLSDRLHFWLKGNNIFYQIKECNNGEEVIVFQSKKEAILFKLTFGGR